MTSALGTKKKPNVLMRYVGKITLVEEEKKTPPERDERMDHSAIILNTTTTKIRVWIIPQLVYTQPKPQNVEISEKKSKSWKPKIGRITQMIIKDGNLTQVNKYYDIPCKRYNYKM